MAVLHRGIPAGVRLFVLPLLAVGGLISSGCSGCGAPQVVPPAGITVSETSGPTTEAGAQATFSVALASQPKADVVVEFTSGDPAEGSASGLLTFTPVNWNAPQTVVVTGVDDDVADGPQSYTVVFSPAQSSDPEYAGMTANPVALLNTDDDTAGLTVSAPSGSTGEAGTQATFTVVLNTQPRSEVKVSVSSERESEGTVGSDELVFTPTNWKAPQTVVVTGVNDDVADGPQTYAVTVSVQPASSEEFRGVAAATVELTNVDDDSAGISVSEVSGPTTEAGGQATFTVVLNSKPIEDVTVSFTSDSTDEGMLTAESLAFTPLNWNAPQTVVVTGVNDDLADGNQPYNIVFADAVSGDPDYAGIVAPSVTLTNTDDETAGITVSALSGLTTEAGGQATFTVVLNSEPYADVTVNFASNNPAEGTLTVSSLTFTAQNWRAPQTVVVTGVNDDLADGNQPYAIVFSATTSADAAYAAITPTNVGMTNTDDDSAGITVSAISGPTSEAGGQATFTVVLNSQPYADVTVNFASNSSDEGTVPAGSITFTPVNWRAPQTVVVTGVNDDLADGNQPYAIAFSATTSADPAYAATTPANVAVTNTDNDSAGITVSAVSGATTEAGGQATFTVVLRSEPFANVTVNFASNTPGEGVTGVSSLLFTPANWNAPRTVTVTGVNDDFADGNQPYAIVFSATTSGDPAYAAITPANVAVTNTDNDSAGITVGAISGSDHRGRSAGQLLRGPHLEALRRRDGELRLQQHRRRHGEPDQPHVHLVELERAAVGDGDRRERRLRRREPAVRDRLLRHDQRRPRVRGHHPGERGGQQHGQ